MRPEFVAKMTLTKAELDGLETCEWAMEHFSGASTNRHFPLRVARRLEAKGLIRSPGLAHPADGDGFIIETRAPRPYWTLTEAGRLALRSRRAR